MDAHELLTTAQAADHVGVHERTIRTWVRKGHLVVHYQAPGVRGLRLFTVRSVETARRISDARRPHRAAS